MKLEQWKVLKAEFDKAGIKVDETLHHRGDPTKPFAVQVRTIKPMNLMISLEVDPPKKVYPKVK